MNERALITGASSGIGLALAREFARHGHPLVINSPNLEELENVAEEITREYEVQVLPLAYDLTLEYAAEDIRAELEDRGLLIHTLVNNAGIGQKGRFATTPLERDIDILRLNVEAVVRMTKLFLPPMLERNTGKILNTASVAGFEPGPNLAVYHASKAFVLSFTEALAVELEETGISVTALCPGATDTDFFLKAGMLQTRVFQEGNLMAPADVATAAYAALQQGDRICVPGGFNKALVAKRRLMTIPATARLNQGFYDDLPPEKQHRHRGDVERAAGQR